MIARLSGAEAGGPQPIHHATAQEVWRPDVAFAGLGEGGEKGARVIVVREAVCATIEVASHFGHALGSELLVEVVPELLDRGAAVYLARAISHPCFRVGRAARS